MLTRIIIVLLVLNMILIILEFIRYKLIGVPFRCFVEHYMHDEVWFVFAMEIATTVIILLGILFYWVITGNINDVVSFIDSINK